eukprot:CAMPEP_0119302514 /NCGR_PEP_ID=MMETSP1333-20130426/4100_1 /TAXON_ID=418940 /ORGANISM="Scyphosphaera apsteinii, Strain RCC1455" /LENGTH=291 /DNA_ID=CAMNT_0007304893 /DNA_START=393 /DNA_END=1268 /DNA_ORIENTATION=+
MPRKPTETFMHYQRVRHTAAANTAIKLEDVSQHSAHRAVKAARKQATLVNLDMGAYVSCIGKESSSTQPSTAVDEAPVLAKESDTLEEKSCRLSEKSFYEPSMLPLRTDSQHPAHRAAKAGQVQALVAELNLGSDADCIDIATGNTLLLSASHAGHLGCVETLLKMGASVNTQNNNGWTALMAATQLNHVNIIRLLLQHGADTTPAEYDSHKTALDLAYSVRRGAARQGDRRSRTGDAPYLLEQAENDEWEEQEEAAVKAAQSTAYHALEQTRKDWKLATAKVQVSCKSSE